MTGVNTNEPKLWGIAVFLVLRANFRGAKPDSVSVCRPTFVAGETSPDHSAISGPCVFSAKYPVSSRCAATIQRSLLSKVLNQKCDPADLITGPGGAIGNGLL